ncbi:putative ADP-ribose pyrophosphatase YjhB [Halobacillus andaensis]|uniref:ADP-ribose pyrophosphatase YjhB n=1 Tax=Halobacillus andaensis TaxID=1176239 RepID=A0A917B5P6_HALAA|nr:NUDIX hydrolase [Halobacillus andaensis]MBP2006080.1 ADP-ribose pyrophosphatase YjhB (NUDIX family) [Halobacillus andaensis]GGF23774.1 putative ADP-ribose pyrophosphatase YjhB [Halobacillus andaensis]
MGDQWLSWAKQIQSTAQAGLSFSKDPYDLERYRQLLELSAEIMAAYSHTSMESIVHLFHNEKGYQTPKIDVRGVVFKDNKMLLVKEKADDQWSLPGGFADVGSSLCENAVREIEEETGYKAKYKRILAILDYHKHPHPPQPFHYYKFFLECDISGVAANETLETSDVQFFEREHLPELSASRNTQSQLLLLFQYLNNPYKKPLVD